MGDKLKPIEPSSRVRDFTWKSAGYFPCINCSCPISPHRPSFLFIKKNKFYIVEKGKQRLVCKSKQDTQNLTLGRAFSCSRHYFELAECRLTLQQSRLWCSIMNKAAVTKQLCILDSRAVWSDRNLPSFRKNPLSSDVSTRHYGAKFQQAVLRVATAVTTADVAKTIVGTVPLHSFSTTRQVFLR
jgi:hypothetical protein